MNRRDAAIFAELTQERDAEDRAFAERFAEIRDRLMSLFGELPLHTRPSDGWDRVTSEITEATKDLRAVSSDWAAYLRGVA